MHQNSDKQFNTFEVRCVGCLIGGIIGPFGMYGLFLLDAFLQPEKEAGGILGYLFFFLISIPAGAILLAIFAPLLLRLIVKGWQRIFSRRNS
jgi:hypothetical protein